MLNKLLSLSEDARYAAIAEISIPDRHVLFNSVPTLTDILNLDKVDDYEERVRLRHEHILKYLDTVFWDFAECANVSSKLRKVAAPDYEISKRCKISTSGCAIVRHKNGHIFIHSIKVNHKYEHIKINDGHKSIHRLVASTFLPRPERLNTVPHKCLQVNHIDCTRHNNALINLEWVTPEENQRHRFSIDRYSEEKYFLFECIIDNGFLGRSFVLSEHDLHLIGTNFNRIRLHISSSPTDAFKGFYTTMIHREDIGEAFVGFPQDIAELFSKEPRYFDNAIKPVIGTVVEGKYKGFVFSLFGAADINRYFHQAHVMATARGEFKKHSGCIFRYATHQDAIPLHNKITKEIVDDIRKSAPYYRNRGIKKDEQNE